MENKGENDQLKFLVERANKTIVLLTGTIKSEGGSDSEKAVNSVWGSLSVSLVINPFANTHKKYWEIPVVVEKRCCKI